MALLQNEDFAIWYLRTSYLASAKDGIAERLINVNSSILNTPGFRAAGWIADPVQRTYSPPIPTSVNTDYFKEGADLQQLNSQDGEEDEGGLVTGRTSNDTIGPALNMRRRRRKEQVEDDDSSDLSDESEDEADGGQRTAQQIRFAKMPSRNRSDSSPIRGTEPDGVTTSPNKQTTSNRRRTGSLGAVEAVKARARRDTTTSSEMSSENEVDPTYFRRRQLTAGQTSKSVPLPGEDPMGVVGGAGQQGGAQDDSDAESVGSAMSSELGDTLDSASLLNTLDDPNLTSTPLGSLTGSGPRSIQPELPRRQRTLPMLHELPPPRPISMIQPRSLLSAALGVQRKGPSNPLQAFAALSGKGNPNPLWIKVYTPFSEDPEEPFEMPLARTSKEGSQVTVVEAIGHALWRYQEQELSPALTPEQLDVNKWTLRMVEDGEIDDDFPPLVRTRPVTDFTDNNNRAGRGRSRGRPFDEFGLVEASAAQYEANKRDTPQINTSEQTESISTPALGGFASQPALQRPGTPNPGAGAGVPRTNILLSGQPFTTALTNTSLTPADLPAPAGPQATPRMGSTKTIRIRYLNHDMTAQSMTMETSTDSYIAEIFDHICKRWNLEKAGFILKVAGTNTVAPLDRTVEALGGRSELDLVRRRFGAGAGVSLTGSPGSSSPNAPLLLDIQGPTKKNKRGQPMQASSLKQDLLSGASNFKKYYVTRKQLGGFAQGSQRVLVFDGDIIHVMPADTSSNAKFSSIAFNDILKCKVSSKHPKLVRIVVRRINESKRYDFEARIAGEAQEIVDEVTREMKLARA